MQKDLKSRWRKQNFNQLYFKLNALALFFKLLVKIILTSSFEHLNTHKMLNLLFKQVRNIMIATKIKH